MIIYSQLPEISIKDALSIIMSQCSTMFPKLERASNVLNYRYALLSNLH